MFAEFEKVIHALVEQGEPLTVEALRGEYRKLLDLYFGPDFAIDTANPGPGVNYNNFSSYLGAYLDPLNTIVTGDGYDLTVVPIPEPTGVLVLAGGAGVSLLRRRRKVA